MNVPSIFNDVIGPVMRGPSSSHSAAAVRIGRIGRELMGGTPQTVNAYFDLAGSLPTTYLSQGSDMGLSAGLLGFDADDERLADYRNELRKAQLELHYFADHYHDPHPNTYNLRLSKDGEEHRLKALSTGGGIIEVIGIDDLDVSFFGDCYGLVIWLKKSPTAQFKSHLDEMEEFAVSWNKDRSLGLALSHAPFSGELVERISAEPSVLAARLLSPVVPVLTPRHSELPFTSASEMERYASSTGIIDLADLAMAYETARGALADREVMEMASRIVAIMEDGINRGLEGTVFRDRILDAQAVKYSRFRQQGALLNLGVLDAIIPNVAAMMEVKSAMGVIVAAPTAGSCGGLPGTLIGVAAAYNLDTKAKARGLLAAGVIGVLVATASTFSAEVCGCQAECGVSSGMIAAAVTSMLGGSYQTSLAAASLALQNIFGMVCDPVANRVEVPCLGKNILAASNGVSCANLALSGFDQVIPFDEVVSAMDQVGRSLPHELRCTARGGLSITPTSKLITERLQSLDDSK
jgi:L-serine dehydratase